MNNKELNKSWSLICSASDGMPAMMLALFFSSCSSVSVILLPLSHGALCCQCSLAGWAELAAKAGRFLDHWRDLPGTEWELGTRADRSPSSEQQPSSTLASPVCTGSAVAAVAGAGAGWVIRSRCGMMVRPNNLVAIGLRAACAQRSHVPPDKGIVGVCKCQIEAGRCSPQTALYLCIYARSPSSSTPGG